MIVSSQTAALTAYVPNWVRRVYPCWPDGGPHAVASRAAVLFLDLAGFSKQTAHLASFGPKGAEDLSIILKDTFAPLVDAIDKDGGDIVAFVGDGIIALWDTGDLARDAQRATSCGLRLQRVNNASASFRMRVVIETGDVFYCRVGETAGRWHYLVVGAPVAAVGTAYRRAAPGDVVLCSAARQILHELVEQDWIDNYCSKVVAVAPVETLAVLLQDQPMSFEVLQGLLPLVVLERGAALDGRWLAEFRNLSIVQVCLSGIQFDDSLLPALQESSRASIKRRSALKAACCIFGWTTRGSTPLWCLACRP